MLHADDPVELGDLRLGDGDPHGPHLFGVGEPRVHAPHRLKRANHEARADEQHERERDLSDHQRVPGTLPLGTRTQTASNEGQHPVAASARKLEHRHHAEQHTRQERDRDGEQQRGRVDGDLALAWKVGRRDGRQHPQRCGGDTQSENRATERQQDALEQEAARDAHPARADRRANRQLLMTPFRSDEHQVRHIRARNQQHDGDRPHQNPQQLAHVAHGVLLESVDLRRKFGVPENLRTGPRRRRPLARV